MRSLSGAWQANREAATSPGSRCERQGPAVGDHDGPGDRETEAGALRLPRPAAIEAHERLEHALQVGWPDARPAVLDRELHPAVAGASGHLDLPARPPLP